MSFSIVIPSKSFANLEPCILAIRAAGETARIIVIDDGIEWGLVDNLDYVPDAWGDVEVFDGEKPFCFARNVNRGCFMAGDDDVIILNDDAILKTEHGFSALAGIAGAFKKYGMVAASCNTVGNPNQHRKYDLEGTPRNYIRDEPRMVCFVCVFIPRTTLDIVGELDERFVHYGMDDDDYSLRVHRAKLSIGIFDGCFVDHGSLTSSYRGGPTAGGDFRPNMRLFIEKWGVDNWGNIRAKSPFAHLFPE